MQFLCHFWSATMDFIDHDLIWLVTTFRVLFILIY